MSQQPYMTAERQARLVSMARLATQESMDARLDGLHRIYREADPVDLALFYERVRPYWNNFSDDEKQLYLLMYKRAEKEIACRAGSSSVGSGFVEDKDMSAVLDEFADQPGKDTDTPTSSSSAPKSQPGEVSLQFDVTGSVWVNAKDEKGLFARREPFNGILPQRTTLKSYLDSLPNNSVGVEVNVRLINNADSKAWAKVQKEAKGKIPDWLYGGTSKTNVSLKDFAHARHKEFDIERALTAIYRKHGGTGTILIEINVEWRLFGPLINLWDRGTDAFLRTWKKARETAGKIANAANKAATAAKKSLPWLLGGLGVGFVYWLTKSQRSEIRVVEVRR